MIYTQSDLMKLIHDTSAVSIWDSSQGPVFWYAANVPGPFYVNTEKVIGSALAERLLNEMNTIISATPDAASRAEQLYNLIMDSYRSNTSWKRIISTMIDRARSEFAISDASLISGGERRDWLFSIPLAYTINLPHLYLFKNKTSYCSSQISSGQSVLHVSDLINNAASYFDTWQPAMRGLKVECIGNLCMNLRGENGLRRLQEDGQKVIALVTIDLDFFRRLHEAGLIAKETFEEISVFFSSSVQWASKYLIDKPELFDTQNCVQKDFERLKYFIAHDPWKIRPQHETFFTNMEAAIKERMSKAA